MKNIILLISVCFGFISFGQRSDLDRKTIKGKVEIITTIEYNVSIENSKIIKKDTADFSNQNIYERFDFGGNLMEHKLIYKNGEPRNFTVYTYFNDGRLKEIRNYNEKGELITKHDFGYDLLGRLIEEREYADSMLITYHNFLYDLNGNLLEHLRYMYPKKPLPDSFTREIYKHDSFGNVLHLEYIYDYDIISTYHYKYDSEQKMIDYRSLNNGVFYKQYQYEYDKKNRLIRKTEINEEGNVSYITSYGYDKKNNLVVERCLDSNDKIINEIKNTYGYDKQGNWISKLSIVNDQTIYLERTIEYYN